jgi:hypothetical protein
MDNFHIVCARRRFVPRLTERMASAMTEPLSRPPQNGAGTRRFRLITNRERERAQERNLPANLTASIKSGYRYYGGMAEPSAAGHAHIGSGGGGFTDPASEDRADSTTARYRTYHCCCQLLICTRIIGNCHSLQDISIKIFFETVQK